MDSLTAVRAVHMPAGLQGMPYRGRVISIAVARGYGLNYAEEAVGLGLQGVGGGPPFSSI